MRIIIVVTGAVGAALLLGWNAGHCTGWFDQLLAWDWSACCLAHDQDYAIGIVKPIADYFLRTCANASLRGMGEVMWFGIAIVGGAISKQFYEKATRERSTPWFSLPIRRSKY
jgi:hypothetical protein